MKTLGLAVLSLSMIFGSVLASPVSSAFAKTNTLVSPSFFDVKLGKHDVDDNYQQGGLLARRIGDRIVNGLDLDVRYIARQKY
jgi:hypothetical protein